ncbi:hypothetical protein [Vibrio europaeus]|uniref:hypothetical protein n=1 Tax=Vibrio europaeus TaxID=300876 RepID=UPI00234205EF|nr:hypothetical protein [Vibrio europaeus]MDC5721817.1 hypothetical protein [Vibrio europaeus]
MSVLANKRQWDSMRLGYDLPTQNASDKVAFVLEFSFLMHAVQRVMRFSVPRNCQ